MARQPRVSLVAAENLMADTIVRAETERTVERSEGTKFKVQTTIIMPRCPECDRYAGVYCHAKCDCDTAEGRPWRRLGEVQFNRRPRHLRFLNLSEGTTSAGIE